MHTVDLSPAETQVLIEIVDRFLVEHSVGIKRPDFAQLTKAMQQQVHARIALASQIRGKLPAASVT